MVNAWIEHVRQYAKDNSLTYGCAISYAAKTYTKKNDKTKPVTPKPKEAPKPVEKPKLVTTLTPEHKYIELANTYVKLTTLDAMKDMLDGKNKDEKLQLGGELAREVNVLAKRIDEAKEEITDPVAVVKELSAHDKQVIKSFRTSFNAYSSRMKKALQNK